MYVQTDHRDATPNTHTQPQRSVIVLDPALRELKELFLLGVQDKSIQIIDWWIMVNRPIPMILLIPIYFCMYIYIIIYTCMYVHYIYIHTHAVIVGQAIAVGHCSIPLLLIISLNTNNLPPDFPLISTPVSDYMHFFHRSSCWLFPICNKRGWTSICE